MTQPEPGTAVAKPSLEARTEKLLSLAKSPEERAQVFAAIDRVQQSRMIGEFAKQLRGTQWSNNALSPAAQVAFVKYALACGTDPTRHWDILGGKVYDNAQLWFDLAASRDDYNGYEQDDLSWNDGLDAAEKDRRVRERARFGLPQDVKGACVVRIYRKGIDRPFIGTNFAGNRVGFNAKLKRDDHKPDGDKIMDPVGEQDPGKTAFTRAFRRAAKTAWPLWPYLRQLPDGAALELPAGTVERIEGRNAVEQVIAQGQALPQEHEKQGIDIGTTKVSAGSGAAVDSPTDPYAADDEAERKLDQRISRES